MYDPTPKVEVMPKLTPKMKLTLDPSNYPPNHVPEEEDSTPSLVNNLIPPPKHLGNPEKNNTGNNKKKEGDREKNKEQADTQYMDKKHAEEDSGCETDHKDDYSEYSDSDFIK